MLRTKLSFFLEYARAIKQPIFIDYIESTGTQWLDTGLYLDSYRIVIEAQGTKAPPSTYSILCSHLLDYAGCALFIYDTNVWGLQSSSALTTASIFERTKLDATFDIIDGFPHAVLTINGETTEYQRESLPPYPRHNIEIFNAQASAHVDKEFVGRVYSFQIYSSDGNLLMDAKPCLHPKTFEACMYDTVSKQYLYNKGTGSFIPAPRFVEYIESDGNQYILDTLQIEPSHKIVIDGQYTYTGPSYQFVAGSAENDWKNQACIRLHSETTALISAGVSSDLFSINSNQRYLWTLDILNGKGYLDNNEVSSFSGFVPSGSSRWGYIGVLFNDAFYNASVGKTYSIKLYDNEVLIRHLRPCLRGNTPCMYDMVEGKYYMNVGTGEFKYGKIKFVDYIGSTGTQYIDTGIYAPDVTRFVVKGTCEPNGMSNAQLLGAKDSSAVTSFFGSRIVSGKQSWYCVVGDSTSIGNPLNLSIIDATIVDDKNQPGTLTDLVEGTTQSFESFVGSTSNFAFLENNLCIFGGSATRASLNATCYELQIYTADGLVRHFKPCIDGNNVKCMYDLVTGKYYYNQGEGEFVVGSESSSN